MLCMQMGISLLSCYHGAQIFEIYGLGKEVVDAAFFGSVSRIGGLSLAEVQRETESFWVKVTLPPPTSFPALPISCPALGPHLHCVHTHVAC